ncbi:MAG: hypothetical protein RIB01_15235 [Balneola sp.]
MQFDYAFLEDVFNTVWDGTNFSNIIFGLKILTVSFIAFRFIYTLTKQTLGQKQLQIGSTSVPIPMTLWHIMTYLVYAIGVSTFDLILNGLDGILGYVISIYTDLDVMTVNIALMEDQPEIVADESWFQVLQRMGYQVLAYLANPTLIIVKILKVLAWVMDLLVYAIFLGQRFFVLLILKITGPLALCASLIPGLGHTFGRWLSLYTRWFFLIIPYSLANVLVAAFVEAYDSIMVGFGAGYNGGYIDSTAAILEVPLILLIVILKPVLYSTGKSLYNYLFDFQLSEEKNN